jgi:hypothetical protein
MQLQYSNTRLRTQSVSQSHHSLKQIFDARLKFFVTLNTYYPTTLPRTTTHHRLPLVLTPRYLK